MNEAKRARKLTNVKLTRRYHFRYLGLWVLLSASTMAAFHAVFYLWIQERTRNTLAVASELLGMEPTTMQWPAVAALVVGWGFFLVALIGLAMFTSHRIAGPYLRLRGAFRSVASGDFNYHLRFRGYDRLEEVADGFNEMMEAFRTELEKARKQGAD
jgi:HAMP domain-containing protein